MTENTDKLKPCLICDNTGFKAIRNIETDKIEEILCECSWGDVSRDYFALLTKEEEPHDDHKRCGVKRIS